MRSISLSWEQAQFFPFLVGGIPPSEAAAAALPASLAAASATSAAASAGDLHAVAASCDRQLTLSRYRSTVSHAVLSISSWLASRRAARAALEGTRGLFTFHLSFFLIN